MATINLLAPSIANIPGAWKGAVTRTSPTEIVISDGTHTISYTGTFQYNAGAIAGGTVTGYDVYQGVQLTARATGISANVTPFDNVLASGDVGESYAYTLAGPDTFIGSAGNDVIRGYDGNDAINGGAGIDTAVFSGNRADYTIMAITNGPTITGYSVHSSANNEGTDTMVNVERIRFADTTVAIDIGGNGGQAYRLYQAAFDRVPDSAGLGFHIRALDNGFSLANIAQNFIDSPEFAGRYGNLDNTQFVTQLYRNVLDREPEAAGLAFHVNNLNGNAVSRAQTLANFSESPENQATLIGVIQDGFSFTPIV